MTNNDFYDLCKLYNNKKFSLLKKQCEIYEQDDIVAIFFNACILFCSDFEKEKQQANDMFNSILPQLKTNAYANADNQSRYMLSQCYRFGYGTEEQSLIKYFAEIKILAEQDFLPAITELATIYYSGQCGVSVDYELSLSLWQKAQQQNDEMANSMIAFYTANGFGTKQMTRYGIRQLKKYKTSCSYYFLAQIFENGSIVKKNEKKAFKYMKKSADQSQPDACFYMFRYYMYGIGTYKNIKKAYDYLDKALNLKCLLAFEEYGVRYFYGRTERQNYPKALEYMKMAVLDNRTVQAKKILASCYEKGFYVPKNEGKAFQLYLQCAETNADVDSIIKVAQMYQDGRGVVKNEKLALAYFCKASSKKSALSDYYLSKFYFDGKFVEKNTEKALELLENSANSGIADAKVDFAVYLYNGKYKQENVQRAYEMLMEAVNLGSKRAYYHLGLLFEYGLAICKSDEEALSYYQKGYEFGDENCAIKVAQFNMLGKGTPTNYEFAVNVFSHYAILGNPVAMTGLAICYKNGFGLKKDMKECVKLLQKASTLACGETLYEIGRLYEDGKSVKPDEKSAYDFYLRATQYGHIESFFKTGINYYMGITVPKDYGTAVEFFKRSACKNHAESQFYLAKCYENGFGVEIDFQKARHWYELAIKNGDKKSCLPLAIICFNEKNYDRAITLFKASSDNLSNKYLYTIYKHGYGVEANETISKEYYQKYIKNKSHNGK